MKIMTNDKKNSDNKKINVVLSGLIYSFTMLHLFWRAFERRDDVNLFVVGPFTGNRIPWKGGITLPQKYVKMPHFPLPDHARRITNFDPEIVEAQLPWKPDLWLEIDASWHFGSKPKAGVVAHILTDPHVLRHYYDQIKGRSDVTFCMQSPYIQEGEMFLPYGYDPEIHYPMELEKEYDACLIGLQYESRNQLVSRLRAKGLKVFYETGLVYDQYREMYNKSKIALSWSSLQDTPARTWEALAMRLPLVANYTPDMERFFKDRQHYLGFSTLDGAVENVMELLGNDIFRNRTARYGHIAVGRHTYDNRIEQILKVCELL